MPLDAVRLRAEAEAMVDAVAGVLVDLLGDGFTSLWFKGSAQKRWDSRIDYVPELSDVDIHFRADAASLARLADLDVALGVHAEIGARFAAACPDPLHLPRPQLVSIDDMERLPHYVPAPPGAVRTLYGAPPPKVELDEERVRAADARSILAGADPGTLALATVDLVDRPGHHLFHAVRALNWRISPLAPRVLTVLGAGYVTAWSANRSEATERLRDLGQDELAGDVATFYEAAWDATLSGWRDTAAGLAAFTAGIRALRGSAALVPAEFLDAPVDRGEARS